MNLFKIKFPFRRSSKGKDPTEATREIAQRLYRNRQIMKCSGSAEEDWAKAQRIHKSPVRRVLMCLNQPLIQAEKKAIEPTARWVENADLFRIIERLSPTLEALGVIAIPLVLFLAAQGYQENLRQQELERIQQQAVTDYLNQLSTVLLDLDGSLGDPQNAELRTLMASTTRTLLGDPNLSGVRKVQVIGFLYQMGLVQREVVYGPQRPEDQIPIIRLRHADLRGISLSEADLIGIYLSEADLIGADLYEADLRGANLIGANLGSADLRVADLREADFSKAYLGFADLSRADLRGVNLREAAFDEANLRFADLREANLIGAYLIGADLREANLIGADLYEADLREANLHGTDLSNARSLTESQLEDTYLCETRLPSSTGLNPNRDCDEEWVPWWRRSEGE